MTSRLTFKNMHGNATDIIWLVASFGSIMLISESKIHDNKLRDVSIEMKRRQAKLAYDVLIDSIGLVKWKLGDYTTLTIT